MRFAILAQFGCLAIEGPDAQRFLQGQLTCDVPAPGTAHNRLGAHCNPQGRVVSLFYLVPTTDGYFLVMPKTLIPIAMNALKKYAVFFKASLRDASEEDTVIGSFDDLSVSLAAPSAINFSLMNNDEWTENKWHLANIEHRIPRLYPETSGRFLPHELNLITLNAVDFDKGCYTGQEIIARMHYRGKPKSHLALAHTVSDTLPQPNADFFSYDDETFNIAGSIIDVVSTSPHHYHLLVLMQSTQTATAKFYLTENTQIEIHLTNQKVNS